jgi:hypothetical protein
VNEENTLADFNYFHKFTRMSLLFSAKSISSHSDSMEIFKYSDIPIQWEGTGFKGYAGITTQGEVALNGKYLSFVWLKDSTYTWQAISRFTFDIDYHIKFLETSPPLASHYDDSIIFLSTGTNLLSLITCLVDTSFVIESSSVPPYNLPKWDRTKKYIFSDGNPSPILSIKFYN